MFTHLDYLYQAERRQDQIRAAEQFRLRQIAQKGAAGLRGVFLHRLASGIAGWHRRWLMEQRTRAQGWRTYSKREDPLYS